MMDPPDTISAPDSASGWVPLDLSRILAGRGKVRKFSIRIENLPHGAQLSQGHNNGDRTWSLRSGEMDGLAFMPPEGNGGPHTLVVRVLGMDGEETEALETFELTVTRNSAPVRDSPPAPADAAVSEDRIEEISARLDVAMARAEQAEAAALAARSEALSELDDRLQTLNSELAATQSALSARDAQVPAPSAETGNGATAQSQPLDVARIERAVEERLRQAHTAELAETRMAWERELKERLAEARAASERELEERLAAARTAAESELEKQVAEAQAQTEEKLLASLEEADREWAAELQYQLDEAAKARVAGEAERMAIARSEWESQSRRTRTSGIAASRQRANRPPRLPDGLGRAGKRAGLIAVCLAAGLFLYPRVEPLAVEMLGPQLPALKAAMMSLLP